MHHSTIYKLEPCGVLNNSDLLLIAKHTNTGYILRKVSIGDLKNLIDSSITDKLSNVQFPTDGSTSTGVALVTTNW